MTDTDKAVEAARRIISFNAMNGNAENDSIDEVCVARAFLAVAAPKAGNSFLDIVFDGPPSHESGRFVEVEDANGRSIRAGEWLQRKDGYWALRIRASSPPAGQGEGET